MLLLCILPLEIHDENAIYRSQLVSPVATFLSLGVKSGSQIIYCSVVEVSLVSVLHLDDYLGLVFKYAVEVVDKRTVILCLSGIFLVDECQVNDRFRGYV